MDVFNKTVTERRLVTGKTGRIHRRSVVWILLAALCLVVQRWIPSAIWDQGYYQGFFIWIRQAYDFVLGWSPMPMVYLVLALLVFRTARWVSDWRKGIMWQVSRAFGGLAALIAVFYIFWGFNYRQISLQDRMGLALETMTASDLHDEFRRATEVLRQEASDLPEALRSDEAIQETTVTDGMLRDDVETTLAALGVPHQGRVRVRQLWPEGFLLRWSTAGIYIPQTGEGHIDKGLLSVQKPFTIAHEMAHGYGITDEGACNFIAWLACGQSRDPWIRYGGALTYWRYVAAEMPSDSVAQVLPGLPPVVTRSIQLVRANDEKYPDLLPRLRNAIYGTYLERHGVKGGLRSYNEVVRMVSAYLKSGSGLQRDE